MTDLELTKACAEAMGYQWSAPRHQAQWLNSDNGVGGLRKRWKHYDPLHDDAQAMQLVKMFGLNIDGVLPPGNDCWSVYTHEGIPPETIAHSQNLNRAIVDCVAKMRPAK